MVVQDVEDSCQGIKGMDIMKDISSTVTPPPSNPIRTLRQGSQSNSSSLHAIQEQAEDPTEPGAQNPKKAPTTVTTNRNSEISTESGTLALGTLNITDENVPQQISVCKSNISPRVLLTYGTHFTAHTLFLIP